MTDMNNPIPTTSGDDQTNTSGTRVPPESDKLVDTSSEETSSLANETVTMTRAELEKQIAAERDKAVYAFMAKDMLAQRAETEKRRQRADLRVGASKLVVEFGNLLVEVAAEMTAQQGKISDAFANDEAQRDLLWLFGEFLVQAQIDRTSGDLDMVQPHQLDEFHASTWFRTDVNGRGEFVPDEA